MPERARENRYRRSICRSRLLQGCARVKVRWVKHSLQVRGIVSLLTTTRSSTDGHRVRQIEASSFGVSTSPSTAVERVTSMWRHWHFPRSAELGPSRKLRVIRGKQRQASVKWLRTNSSPPYKHKNFQQTTSTTPSLSCDADFHGDFAMDWSASALICLSLKLEIRQSRIQCEKNSLGCLSI